MENKLSKLGKYSFLFIITGILIIIFFLIDKKYLAKIDLKELDGSLDEGSNFYLSVGIIWIIIGLIYWGFDIVDKIQLSIKLVILHYWFTFFFLIVLIVIPILDKYYPTDESSKIFSTIFGVCSVFSILFFITGKVLFIVNIVRSRNAYNLIKNKWQ